MSAKKTVVSKQEIIFAGFGGQGILLLGKFLSYCAVREGLFTTFMPSYGAEVRGGTAYSMTIVSGSPIPSNHTFYYHHSCAAGLCVISVSRNILSLTG